jgi:cytochrome c
MTHRTIIVLVAAGFLATTAGALADGDPEAGKKHFRQCGVCHGLEHNKRKIGPPLRDVIGRKAGSASGYKYSASFLEAGEKGLVWDKDNLMTYLENPTAFVKSFLGKDKVKIKMFNKFKKEAFRRDVIAYLEEASK